MSNSLVAVRYARAIWDLAQSKGLEAEVLADMESISSTLKEHTELEEVLKDPTIQGSVKRSILLGIWNNGQEITKGLVEALTNNGRLPILGEVALEYKALHDSRQLQDKAVVYSATPLESDVLSQIKDKLQAVSRKQMVIENEIRPELIGGFVIRWGDLRYDASVSQKLTSLKREFTNSI